MKAKQDFRFCINDEGIPVSHRDGESLKGRTLFKIKASQEIPKEIASYVFQYNKSFIDLKYKDGVLVVPDELKGKKAPPLVRKEKYTKEKLHKVFNKKGMEGLKKIGARFNPPITDRSADRLMSEILTAQNKLIRTGKRIP